MPIIEQAKQLLDISKLDFPERPRIVGIEVEEFIDHGGDDALWVYAILDEATQTVEMTGEAVMQIKSAVHDVLYDAGVTHFSYVRFLTASEFAELRSIGAAPDA